jgi:hypothetical protein
MRIPATIVNARRSMVCFAQTIVRGDRPIIHNPATLAQAYRPIMLFTPTNDQCGGPIIGARATMAYASRSFMSMAHAIEQPNRPIIPTGPTIVCTWHFNAPKWKMITLRRCPIKRPSGTMGYRREANARNCSFMVHSCCPIIKLTELMMDLAGPIMKTRCERVA